MPILSASIILLVPLLLLLTSLSGAAEAARDGGRKTRNLDGEDLYPTFAPENATSWVAVITHANPSAASILHNRGNHQQDTYLAGMIKSGFTIVSVKHYTNKLHQTAIEFKLNSDNPMTSQIASTTNRLEAISLLRGRLQTLAEDAAESDGISSATYAPDEILVDVNQRVEALWYGATSSWALDRIDQTSNQLNGQFTLASGVTGTGVDIFIVDTGIWTSHPDFTGRAQADYSAYGSGQMQDCHGTDFFYSHSNPSLCSAAFRQSTAICFAPSSPYADKFQDTERTSPR
jgi:subtilisin family serine protease